MSLKDISKLILEQWLNVLQTLAVVATLIAVIKYTIETKKLREATVKQKDLMLRPCVTVYYDPGKAGFRVRNIGHSTALNIMAHPVKGISFSIDRSNLLPPDDSSILYAVESTSPDRIHPQYHISLRIAGEDYELLLTYENLENDTFYSRVRDCTSN